MILGCNKTTTLMSLLSCYSHGINSTHHCHYTMAPADSNRVISLHYNSLCSVFNLNNKNANALIAHELLGFTSTCSLTMK